MKKLLVAALAMFAFGAFAAEPAKAPEVKVEAKKEAAKAPAKAEAKKAEAKKEAAKK